MKQRDPLVHVRLPHPAKEWIEREAARTRRTQNAQIVFIVEEAMRSASEPAAGEALGA